MSREAVKWAMEDAPPMPPQLVATLTGLAYHADKYGRGAFPSVARLSAYACKDKRSVQRDLKALRALGLIHLGDQSKAAHLPEGKRPEVYDLALDRVVQGGRAGTDEATLASRVTLASSRRRGGRNKPTSDMPREPLTGDVGVTGDVDVTPDVGVVDGVTPTSLEGWRGRHPNQKKNQKTEERSRGGNGSQPVAHLIPDDFSLSDTMRRWAKSTFHDDVDPIFETEKFIAHWRAEGRRKTNWYDAWTKWMLDAAEYQSKQRRRGNRYADPAQQEIY